MRGVLAELDKMLLQVDSYRAIDNREKLREFKFTYRRSIVPQFLDYEKKYEDCLEVGVNFTQRERMQLLINSLPRDVQYMLVDFEITSGG